MNDRINHTISRSRYELVVVAAIICLLIFGASFRFESVWNSLASNIDFSSLAILLAEFALISGAIVLYKRRSDMAFIVLAVVFVAFSIFHAFNLGRPCGCFGDNSISSAWMVLSNSAFAMGLAMIGLFNAKKKSGTTVRLFSILSFIVAFGVMGYDIATAENASGDWFNACDYQTESQPFLRLSKSTPSFAKGSWEFCLLHKECETCTAFIESELDIYNQQLFYKTSSNNVAIFRDDSSSAWQIAELIFYSDQPEKPIVIPKKIHVLDGNIVDCSQL